MNEKSNLITSVYASSGRGGGTGDIGRREYTIQHDAYGNQNFDQIARWNAGLSNDIGLPDFADTEYRLAGSSDNDIEEHELEDNNEHNIQEELEPNS